MELPFARPAAGVSGFIFLLSQTVILVSPMSDSHSPDIGKEAPCQNARIRTPFLRTSTEHPMSSRLHDVWTAERSQGLRRLKGSRVSGVVPIRQELVERLLGRRGPGVLGDIHVTFLPANRVRVAAVVNVFGFRKQVEAVLKWPPAVDFRDPTVRLVFVERSPLVAAASLAAPLLGRLPGGISISDGGVTVDLPTVFEKVGLADLLPHVRSLALEGAEGVLWLNLEIEVVDGPQVIRRKSRSAHSPADVDAADLLDLFSGTRLSIVLRAHESLLPDFVNAGLATTAREPGGVRSGGSTSLASLLSPLEIRLEQEAMVVATELRVNGSAEKT